MTRSASEAPKIHTARFVAGASRTNQLPPPTGFEVAFAGRSNVGKSSLMNSLMQRRNLVRTSSTPGCTRQISFFEVATSEGATFTLVDLPGYGYAKRSKAERKEWAELIEGYLLERPTLKAVCVLFDVRRGPQEEELGLLELLAQPAAVTRAELQRIVVATKLDKVASAKRKADIAKAQGQLKAAGVGQNVVGFSTRLPTSQAELWKRLHAVFRGEA